MLYIPYLVMYNLGLNDILALLYILLHVELMWFWILAAATHGDSSCQVADINQMFMNFT